MHVFCLPAFGCLTEPPPFSPPNYWHASSGTIPIVLSSTHCGSLAYVPSSWVSSCLYQMKDYVPAPCATPFPFMLPIRSRQHWQVCRDNFLRVPPLCSRRSRESTPPWPFWHNHIEPRGFKAKGEEGEINKACTVGITGTRGTDIRHSSTGAAPTRPATSSNLPPTYINTETHWWDASQIYGSSKEQQALRRSGRDGKLIIGSNGLLQLPSDPNLNPAMVPGWWLGLEMMETLFTLEHNAICDRLHTEYPYWSDDDIFERARLINAALTAKIHTVEWTPAIISHPTSQFALKANWWGIEMERLNRIFGRLSSSEVISGIPGSETDHFGVPYCLTEEFTIVYRMHPLIPDDYSFRSAVDGRSLLDRTFSEIAGPHAEEVLQEISMTDAFYTFGISYPGAIILNNFPRFLQHFERPDGYFMDLAATDIMRTRELGVPRYNQFRKLLHLSPASSFEELAGDPALAEKLRRVYHNDIDRVDLMVGMFAEKRPQGFAFSETAFRIFILMASRRLNSDRFLTVDFKPQVYTQVGMDWIRDNSMSTVLLRHYPHLRSALRSVDNAFTPWARATM